MSKYWFIIKQIICKNTGEQCGPSCDYEIPVLIPDCLNCDIYEHDNESWNDGT